MNVITVKKVDHQFHVFDGETELAKIIEGNQQETLVEIGQFFKEQPFLGGVLEFSKGATVEEQLQQEAFRQRLMEESNHPFVFTEEIQQDVVAALEVEAARQSWQIDYFGYQTGKDEYARESLLTVGNGLLGLRGTTPEMRIGNDFYPATYVAGLYNEAVSTVAGAAITNEDFVNAPNLQFMTLIVDGEVLEVTQEQVMALHRTLDLQTGLFTADYWVTLGEGKQLHVTFQRVASMANPHYYSLSYTFTPLNFSGEVEIVTAADGEVYNYNVERYRSLTNRHLAVTELVAEGNKSRLVAKTLASELTILQEAVLFSETLDLSKLVSEKTGDLLEQRMTVQAEKNQSYTLEKTVSLHLYQPTETLITSALTEVVLPNFTTCYEASKSIWQKLWQSAAIQLTGDFMSEKLLHLHTYHLLASGSPTANPDLDVSITARGLHGEAYRGHIFWDELFILPFYILHFPETAKALLMYRYRRLGAAQEAAKAAGESGAMFPWQSGLDGSEQSQELHLNPLSGEWGPDYSRLQRHVSLAIAYNVWLYYNCTEDQAFMEEAGLELLAGIAKFWINKASYDETTKRYSIAGVMGPDEFHEAYPDSQEGGLRDNAYTNMMVVWLAELLGELASSFPTAFQTAATKAELTEEELAILEKLQHQLALEMNDQGIIAQFAGYFDLKEIDWSAYREKYGNIYRMDRILSAEGHSADEYKVAKQADSLMIFYNFNKEKVDQILLDLGYSLPENYLEENLNYYLARTSHGSTLSRVVHAQLAEMIGNHELAWQLYQEALHSDYQDIQGGTTAEGIHAGVMGATIFVTLATYAGLDVRQKDLHITPRLPKQWQNLRFAVTFKGVDFKLAITPTDMTIVANQKTIIVVGSKKIDLEANQPITITYGGEAV